MHVECDTYKAVGVNASKETGEPVKILCNTLLSILFVSFAAPQVHAQTATATINRERVYVGNEVTFTIEITDSPADGIPEVVFPESVRGSFVNSGQKSTTSTRIVNGQRQRVTDAVFSYNYRILVRDPGTVIIPAIDINLRSGETVKTRPIRFEALLPQPAPSFSISISTPRNQVYVGETFTATVEWLMPESVRNANFDSSQFPKGLNVVPSTQPVNRAGRLINFNFLGNETIGAVEEVFSRDGRQQTRFRFELLISPDRSGTFTLGPVRVVFDRPAPGTGFTRVYAESEPLRIDALPLPTIGRPDAFNGLIGEYTLETSASTSSANVGDPITFEATIRGLEPMIGADSIPELSEIPGFAGNFRFSPDGWTTRRSSEPNERVFTTTIRALNADLDAIPPIMLVSFNPETSQYTEVRSDPIPIVIRAVREATVADAVVAPGRNQPLSANRPTLEPSDPAFWAPPSVEQVLQDRPFELRQTLSSPVAITTLAAGPSALFLSMLIATVRRRNATPERLLDRALRNAEHLAIRSSPADAARTAAAVVLGCDRNAVTISDIDRIPAHEGIKRTLREALSPTELNTQQQVVSASDTKLAIHTLRKSLSKMGGTQ